MANFTGVAVGRHAVLARAGWDVERDGLQGGAPEVTVVAGADAHVTLFHAIRMLGLGSGRVRPGRRGRPGPHAAGRASRRPSRRVSGPTIVCLQAGNVNSGAFDPLAECIAIVRERRPNAWIHVDGAFGLWAAAAPSLRASSPRHRRRRLVVHGRSQVAQRAVRHGPDLRARPGRAPRGDERHRVVPLLRRGAAPRPGRLRAGAVAPRARLPGVRRAAIAGPRRASSTSSSAAAATRAASPTSCGPSPASQILNDVVLNQVLVRFDDSDDANEGRHRAPPGRRNGVVRRRRVAGPARHADLRHQLVDARGRRRSLAGRDPEVAWPLRAPPADGDDVARASAPASPRSCLRPARRRGSGRPRRWHVLEGRPLLQHVLDAVAAAGLREVMVVLGAAARRRRDGDPRGATSGGCATRHPERGLALVARRSASRLALDDVAAALVVLGDQPRLRPDVIAARRRRVARRSIGRSSSPRYDGDGALNPVLLDRAVFPLAFALDGDRGMGPLIHRSPDLVADVRVGGDNPDVDTPADLERLARPAAAAPASTAAPASAAAPRRLRLWRRLRRSRRPGPTAFAREPRAGRPVSRGPRRARLLPPDVVALPCRPAPHRTTRSSMRSSALTGPTTPGSTSAPARGGTRCRLARRVREVIALDPSAACCAACARAWPSYGIANVRVVEGRWPADAADLRADVALIAHVGYDVEAIGPFLDAMERPPAACASRCSWSEAPAFVADPFWPPIHGEERVSAAGARPDSWHCSQARGRRPEVRRVDGRGPPLGHVAGRGAGVPPPAALGRTGQRARTAASPRSSRPSPAPRTARSRSRRRIARSAS